MKLTGDTSKRKSSARLTAICVTSLLWENNYYV